MPRATLTAKHESDGGAAMRVMRIRLGHLCDDVSTPRQKHRAARRKVIRNCKNLLDVFDAIVRNGQNRRASIEELACRTGMSFDACKKKYFRERNKLLKLFNVKREENEPCLFLDQ